MIRINPIVKQALSTRALLAGAIVTYGFSEDKRWAKWFGGIALAGVVFEAFRHVRAAEIGARRKPPALDVTPQSGTDAVASSAAASQELDPLNDSALPDDSAAA